MATINELPAEITSLILGLLTGQELRASSCAVLRACKKFYLVGSSLLERSITITSRNCTGFATLPEEQQYRYLHNIRELNFDLVGFLRCFCASPSIKRGLPFAPFDLECSEFDKWRSAMNLALREFCTRLPDCQRLTHVGFRARSRRPPLIQLNMPTNRAYIDPPTLMNFVQLVSAVSTLTSLTIDTSDTEASTWTAMNGLGFECKTHVCPKISELVARSPTLKHLRVRRREMCPALFRFAFDPKHRASAQLETLLLNLRLFENQNTDVYALEALSRHCRCMCRCEACDNVLPPNYPLPAPFPVFEQLKMVAPDAATGLPNIKTFKILAFEKPSKPLINCARVPCVYDALTGKTLVAVDSRAHSRMDWEDAQYVEQSQGWELSKGTDGVYPHGSHRH